MVIKHGARVIVVFVYDPNLTWCQKWSIVISMATSAGVAAVVLPMF